jgi:hypothetical protein
MSANVSELFADRVQTMESSGKYKSIELFYLANNVVVDSPVIYINSVAYPVTTEHAALEAVRKEAPRVMYGMARKELRISEKVNETAYKVGVTYAYSGTESPDNADDDRDMGDRTISFSGAGGTRHITHSLRTLYRSEGMPDYGGAINVDNAGNIHGIDIPAPMLTFSETHFMTYKKFKVSYIRQLMKLEKCVNDKAFRGFEKGEVFFDHFDAVRRGTKREDLYEVTFHFAVIPNQPEMMVQNIKVPAKDGWDYVWYKTTPESKGEKKSTGAKLDGCAIEQIYQLADFGLLGIKTGPFTPVVEKA